ncbi:hypothetical protein ACIRQH_34845 [Streptomyces sp. NPDC102279]|uniref:hypothetical protein n=1 Tax=Streptomyces sp. NPDC102279 TaxID=3366153 RepID=UPI003808EC56
MTGLLIFDAIDTAGRILDAIFLWIVAAAFVATVAIYTVVLTGVVTWRAIRRGLTGAWRAAHHRRTPEPHPAPSWAHTEPPSYDEAA